MVFIAGGLVDESDPRGFAVFIKRDFPSHGIGKDVKIASGQGRLEMHGMRIVVCANCATTMAVSCPEARRT